MRPLGHRGVLVKLDLTQEKQRGLLGEGVSGAASSEMAIVLQREKAGVGDASRVRCVFKAGGWVRWGQMRPGSGAMAAASRAAGNTGPGVRRIPEWDGGGTKAQAKASGLCPESAGASGVSQRGDPRAVCWAQARRNLPSLLNCRLQPSRCGGRCACRCWFPDHT